MVSDLDKVILHQEALREIIQNTEDTGLLEAMAEDCRKLAELAERRLENLIED